MAELTFEFLKNNFIQEARELLENLETQLLVLEKEPEDSPTIQEVFRITHTLKGSAAMFGFDRIGELTHHLENIYDSIRKGTIKASEKIITLTLKSADFLKLLLDSDEKLKPDEEQKYNSLFNEIKANSIKDKITEKELPTDNQDDESKETKLFFIHFKPDKDIFTRGINPYLIFDDFNNLGKVWSDPPADPGIILDDESKKDFTGEWKIYLATNEKSTEIEGIFFFFNEKEYKIFEINPAEISKNKEFKKYFSDSFKQNPDFKAIEEVLSGLKERFFKKEIEKSEAFEIFDNNSEETSQQPKEDKHSLPEKATLKRSESIRVSSNKLDELINLVSELVIMNSQLSFLVKDTNDPQLKKTINTLEKLYKQLRNNALELRLVPLKSVTLKFQRLVRDLSGKLNKDVDLVVVGDNTELDSNMISLIESPLMHIIRNSMDHGIEDAETRIKQGKNPKGIIRLIAFYSGANVFIQVQDDGKGIDTEFIRKKAIDKGLINPTDKLSDQELYDIIFLPGFSTAQGLSEVSGRGVGLDVVKKNIQELRGSIEVDSEIGLGTSFTLKLPLTLTIIDTLLVKVDNRPYLVPLSFVDSCHKINHAKITEINNKHIDFNDELIPFIYLREFLKIQGETPNIENLIILKYNDKKYGLIADKVIGEHQAVVKPLGQIHKKQEYLTGAGILGNGNLALILDTNKLISTIKKEAIYN